MTIKTNAFALISLAAIVLLCCACTSLPVSKMVLVAEVSFAGRPDSVDTFDVDNDGYDEIILQQNLQLDRGDGITYSSKRITVYNKDFHSVFDQVNTGVSGHCSIRRDPGTGEALFGITHIKDNTIVWSEFDVSGNERNTFTLEKVVDRNGNGTWEGRTEVVGWLDINNDRRADAIFCLMATYDKLPRKLMAVDEESGTVLWEFQCGSITRGDKVFIEDIDDDGERDILIGTTGCDDGVELNGFSDESSYLIALDLRGQVKWQRRIGGRFSDCRPALVADIDQDGRTEILFQKTSHSERPVEKDGLYIYNGTTGRVEKFLEFSSRLFKDYLAEDIQSDSWIDIVILSRSGELTVLDHSLRPVASHKLDRPLRLSDMVAFDHDDDGNKEIFLYGEDGTLVSLTNRLDPLAADRIVTSRSTGSKAHFLLVGGIRTMRSELALVADNVYSLKLSPHVARIVYDLQTPIIIGSAIIIAMLVVFLARTNREVEREKLILRNSMAGDNQRAIIVFNAKLKLEKMNPAASEYIDPLVLGGKIPAGEDKTDISTEIKSVLRDLSDTPAHELRKHGVFTRSGKSQVEVDILTRKLIDSHGDVMGYLVTLQHSYRDRWIRMARENVHIGQELMHKIKTLISVYRTDIYLLKKIIEADSLSEELQEVLDEMFEISDDITEITKTFLSLSRDDLSTLQEVDFNDLLRETVNIITSGDVDNIKFKFELDRDIPPVRVDREQMESLILNLAENSMFAIEGEGLITLKTGVLRRLGEEGEHQDFLEFTISDNGSGFDERLIPRLFEPGYSGFPGRVGLGLTICKRIVENHEGKILIKSIEGRGTIVTIRIPFRSYR